MSVVEIFKWSILRAFITTEKPAELLNINIYRFESFIFFFQFIDVFI